MYALRCRFLVALCILAAANLAVGQDGAFDAACRATIQKRGVGLSIAVVKDRHVVFAKSYGKCSISAAEPVTVHTRFGIGSVSKQFTCACVLLLQEDGKLAVDDPVAKYYPGLTRAADITLLDLMNHVSGYPDYYPLDFVDARMSHAIDPDELIRTYAGAELDFEPHSRWSYSNTGYIVLGRVVEKVSGKSMGEFLRERIFDPLQLTDTVFEPAPGTSSLASGHVTFALGDPEPCTPEASGWIGAAGGIWSTASDVARWDIALMGGDVLSAESRALMTTSRECTDGRQTGYGCGLALHLRDGLPVWAHGGAIDGYHASNAMVPTRGVAVVILDNCDGGSGDLAERLMSLALGESAPRVPTVSGPPIADVVRDTFTGLQSGDLERSSFTPDFDAYLTVDRARAAAKRLLRFGAPERIDVVRSAERGGMEVSTSRLTFASGTLRVLMYRHTDGKIAEFFVSKE